MSSAAWRGKPLRAVAFLAVAALTLVVGASPLAGAAHDAASTPSAPASATTADALSGHRRVETLFHRTSRHGHEPASTRLVRALASLAGSTDDSPQPSRSLKSQVVRTAPSTRSGRSATELLPSDPVLASGAAERSWFVDEGDNMPAVWPGYGAPSPLPSTTEAPVALVRWPEEVDRYRDLVRSGLPRVLVIGPRAVPPPEWDELEDWVRAPLDWEEVAARQAVLARRYRAAGPRVSVDEFGVFSVGERVTGLTGLQRAVVSPLIERFGQPVGRARLHAAYIAAGGEEVSQGLRGVLLRLRRRIEPLGVRLQTLRGGALMLEYARPALT